MARKPLDEIAYEFDSIATLPGTDQHYFYSVGSYNESKQGMDFFLDQVARTRLKAISYEQFYLTPDDTLKRMADANKRTVITLSPESHDIRISKMAGRGVYTNDELEAWLDKALGYGIHQVDIWYFVGMREQDEKSVMGSVEYCERLLRRFAGRRVNPMICPMIPFLDPASTFFEYPEEHGYTVFYRTAEQHRRGMERASIINRINYETRWLSRADLVRVGFKAVRSLMEAKAAAGALPHGVVKDYNRKIDDALAFIPVVHEADCIGDTAARAAELDRLGAEILTRNNAILFSGVMNQAVPLNREIGGRWFDELGWDAHDLEAFQGLTTDDIEPAVQEPRGASSPRANFPLQHGACPEVADSRA
jgi:clorobiocin biosynthesis protein CloN6